MDWMASSFTSEALWVIFGLTGQAVLSVRYIVRWLAEDAGQSDRVPAGFWVLSLAGSAILLFYAIFRLDPVFIIGQTMAMGIYAYSLHRLIAANAAAMRSVRDEASTQADDRGAPTMIVSGPGHQRVSRPRPLKRRASDGVRPFAADRVQHG